MSRGPGTFYDRVIKRAVDVAVSSATLVVLSPLLAGVAVAVRRKSTAALCCFASGAPGDTANRSTS